MNSVSSILNLRSKLMKIDLQSERFLTILLYTLHIYTQCIEMYELGSNKIIIIFQTGIR